jgi:hypothetical protein
MFRALTVVAAMVGFALVPVSQASPSEVVLGKRNLLRYGIGWGTAHPRLIFNGGVPSGKAWSLRWRDWGAPVSRARGLTWIYTPHGGYYGKPGAVELRAYGIGRCSRDGPRAYTRLQVRAAVRPGGALSRWFFWGGWRQICHWP